MRTLIVLLGLLSIGASNYEAEVLKVYDADTIRCRVEVWPGDTKTVGIRVFSIDGPEKNFPFGKVVKKYTEENIPVGSRVILNDIIPDKYYGRAVARVEVPGVGDWATHMIEKNYAKRYDGGSKAGLWTECELQMVECG